MNQCPISCDLHDYLEIACLYGYQVKLTLDDHQIVKGKAIDTKTLNKREYLIIDNGQKRQIELNHLKKLQVLTQNARFTEVYFPDLINVST